VTDGERPHAAPACRSFDRRTVFGLPVRLGGGFLFAVAATVAWLSLAFGEFMFMLAVVPFAGAVGLQVAAWRHRR
jgi:hypothetical protein